MKVGTDGTLLGAWAGSAQQPQSILDIGTGTGLIALMLAQRFPAAHVTAIEIDAAAAKQAEKNTAQSNFAERICVYQADIFSWAAPQRFDLLVCNPPFYPHAHPTPSAARQKARHGFALEKLLEQGKQLLHPNGRLAMILPLQTWASLQKQLEHWQLIRSCTVRPTPQKPPHRLLFELSPTSSQKVMLSSEELTIESGGRHDYSVGYKRLTKDFYLNF